MITEDMTYTSDMTDKNLIDSTNINVLLEHFPKGIIAFDMEMTGLTPSMDKIIEISAIKVSKEGVETFSTLVNPKINISEESTAIHGITDQMVKSSPSIEDVIPEFFKFTKKNTTCCP